MKKERKHGTMFDRTLIEINSGLGLVWSNMRQDLNTKDNPDVNAGLGVVVARPSSFLNVLRSEGLPLEVVLEDTPHRTAEDGIVPQDNEAVIGKL